MLDGLQSMAKWFGDLPAPVQSFAIALAAMAAAIGPLLLIAGQFATAIAAIGPVLGALGVGLGVSVTALLGWAAAIAAAIAGLVALGAWVYSNWDKIMSALSGALSSVIKGLDQFVGFLQNIVPATSAAGVGLANARKGLEDYAAELDKAGKKQDDFNENLKLTKLKDLTVKDIEDIKKAISGMSTLASIAAKDQVNAQKELAAAHIDTTAALVKAVDDQKKAVAAAQYLYQQHKGTLQDVQAAEVELAKAEKQLTDGSPNLVAARKAQADAATKAAKETESLSKAEIAHEKAMAVVPAAYYAIIKSIEDYNQKQDDEKKKLDEHQQALNVTMAAQAAWATSLNGQVTPAVDDLTVSIERLVKAHTTLVPQVNATYDALKTLGMKSADVYRTAADEAKKAYDTIAADSDASLYQQTQARLNWLELEKQAAVTAGQVWSATNEQELKDLQATLDQLEQKTTKHTQKTKTIWTEWAKAIGQTVQQFIGSVVERLFSGSDANKQLDQQAADLQKSLVTRAADYQKSIDDIAGKQAAADKEYADSLAQNDQDLADSLATRQKAYDDYAATVPQLLADAEAKAQDEFKSTTSDLSRELQDRTTDYTRYVEDVTQNIQEIRQKHAEQLAGELSDLQDSLDKQGKEYERFVEDAKDSLRELREKHGDNIEDETQNTEDNIRDQTKDYTRYAEDVAKKIKQLRDKNGGVYSDEEGDLVTSLQRRQDDLQQYISDQQRDLEEYKARQLRDQQEEEDALKTALARKAEDQASFQADIQKQRDQAIAQHQEQQDQEIADQVTALTRKTADYEQYVTDNKAQMVAAEQAYQTSLDTERAELQQSLKDRKQDLETGQAEALKTYSDNQGKIETTTGDLKTELANQKADYDQFVQDITGPGGKLEELKNQHTSIWGDIGTLAVGALGKIGEKMLEIAGEKYLGVLLTKLGELIGTSTKLGEILSNIGGSLSGAAGSAGSAAGSAGSSAGSAGSGAASGVGSAAGGALGIVNAITGAVSAVTDVIGVFQTMHMETALKVIVLHTLQTANDLANLRRDDWDRHGEYAKWKDDILQVLWIIKDNTSGAVDHFPTYATWKDDILAVLWNIKDNTSDAVTELRRIEPDMVATNNLLSRLVAVESDAAAYAGQTFSQVNARLDRIAVSTDRAVNMNLYGTDPTLVASQIATQLRLQGGVA